MLGGNVEEIIWSRKLKQLVFRDSSRFPSFNAFMLMSLFIIAIV
jgi:hypothetical protein